MKYFIEQSDSKFAYLQLYQQLKKDIVSGILPLGSKLPSKRFLAEETGTSVITVEHAYSILCDEGYVEARQRRGYFVIYRESEFISFPQEGNDILIGFNPKFFIDALRVIDEEEVSLYMVNPKAPCFIKDDEGKFIYLILPVNFNAATA